MSKLSIRDLDLKGKRVFMRVDFNVPLSDDGKTITSDKRIRASLPSIQYILEQGAGLVLASHLGRPKGKRIPEWQLYNETAGPLPHSRPQIHLAGEPSEDITLVPYGCSTLRITEFPVVR